MFVVSRYEGVVSCYHWYQRSSVFLSSRRQTLFHCTENNAVIAACTDDYVDFSRKQLRVSLRSFHASKISVPLNFSVLADSVAVGG